ncbi:MAG TPA: CHAT domain-containing protein, partial [Pseudomonadota bacterium]|nr:CHAT domain-containing protein [Pseudomonadota bacterium]
MRLLLQFERKEAASDPFAFRFEPQDYILPSQDGEAAEAHFPWSAPLVRDLDALRRPGRPAQLVAQFAERLRQFVAHAGWSSYVARIESARAAGQQVELLIRSAAAELYTLPWELLSLRPGGPCLGELGNVLLRYVWPACPVTSESPQPRPEGGRILLAWSAAGGAVPAGEHVDAIARACQLGSHSFVSDPLRPDSDVLPHASARALVRRLEAARSAGQPISVLHLLCHGAESQGSFGLCLDGQDGQAVVDGYELRQVLAPFSDMVRLVVLSACDSGNTGAMGCAAGSVAQALHRGGFASVLASRFPLSVPGSVAFCQAFYRTLLTGPDSLERAFLAARSALAEAALEQAQRDRPLDWASLQLYGHPPQERDTRPLVFRPYRGLLAFQPEHRRLFFGRDAESAEILGDLKNLERENKPRFLVVAGASGTGKSSVVLASAVPRLLEQHPGAQLRVIRPGSAPLEALQQGLAESAGPLLLVVDQFEELFTQTATPAKRQAFVQELWRLSCQAAPLVRVIITLRVDFV